MQIKGMGTIKKEEAMKILTREGREAVEAGEITLEELGEMYKLNLTKKASKIGNMNDTFRANYKRIPQEVIDKLNPTEIAMLVDGFYDCYSDGKNANQKG